MTYRLLHRCPACKDPFLVMIYTGKKMTDAAQFEPYIAEVELYVKAAGLPAIMVSSPQDISDSESPSWRMQVWPERKDPQFINDHQMIDMIDPLIAAHCKAGAGYLQKLQLREERG